MFRIWAKVIRDDKIVKDLMYENDGRFDTADFEIYMSEICYQMDLPTPLTIFAHIRDFVEFNHHIYRPSDFVEAVDFDGLDIENC